MKVKEKKLLGSKTQAYILCSKFILLAIGIVCLNTSTTAQTSNCNYMHCINFSPVLYTHWPTLTNTYFIFYYFYI